MTEQIENAETEQPTEPITEQAQDKKPKVSFTPEQQSHINGLLKREREKETAKWTDLVTAKDSQIAEYETGLQAVIDVQTAEFNPLVKKLLKNQPVMEQWKSLQDPEFVTVHISVKSHSENGPCRTARGEKSAVVGIVL